MKKVLSLLCLLLSGCTAIGTSITEKAFPSYLQEQTVEQLHLPEQEYTQCAGMWFAVSDYAELLTLETETAFAEAISQRFAAIAELGIDTLLIQVRMNGDAYYTSELYPRGAYWQYPYDPFAIMLAEARTLGLSVHAWVNPFRCQTEVQMASVSPDYQTRAWVDAQSDRIVCLNGRWYLNPAYAEVRELICAGAAELLDGYGIDGIHIDDYFYPTTDANFDAGAFVASGSTLLADWRCENINAMVRSLYTTVHNASEDAIFSISPQGKIAANSQTQYADVVRWCAETGYCDWMIPQLYYGFLHETCPYAETAAAWAALPRSETVSLLMGINSYKVGTADQWAGSGASEWMTEIEIPARQILSACELSGCAGVMLYRAATTLALSEPERIAIQEALEKRT